MKALRASAGTSQPVLSSQQVQTVFYQVPELRDMHQSFYSGLKVKLSTHCQTELCPQQESGPEREMRSCGEEMESKHRGFELIVGDLFLKMVSYFIIILVFSYSVMLQYLKSTKKQWKSRITKPFLETCQHQSLGKCAKLETLCVLCALKSLKSISPFY